MPKIPHPLRAPDFAPGVWIQGPALSVPAARGRVVLVDFWESTCVNCLRTLPFLIAWHERYAARGLSIVGVHSPEFDFTADPEHVARAVAAEKIPYAVLSDPQRATWKRFANKFWPAKYLIDARGYLRYETFGEGSYEETERWLQRLLGEAADPGPWPEPWAGPDGPGADIGGVGAVCRPSTAETHVGWHRGRLFAPEGYRPGEVVRHAGLPSAEIPLGAFTARGAWRHEAEYLESAEAGAEIELRYDASGVNLVLDPAGTAEIWLDGVPVPESERGADVAAGAAGAIATWERGRMVRLIAGDPGEHRLTIRFAAPGVRAYAFSFGRCG
ncbi:MAG TPA: redoxin domain-containing protein [Thermoanaerobaculia bacterium]|jgi:thiol-disulfide isomerase/thioredoxin|nr:redoxin domain-containing protein [Thermoanaerobaculia bacterium]